MIFFQVLCDGLSDSIRAVQRQLIGKDLNDYIRFSNSAIGVRRFAFLLVLLACTYVRPRARNRGSVLAVFFFEFALSDESPVPRSRSGCARNTLTLDAPNLASKVLLRAGSRELYRKQEQCGLPGLVGVAIDHANLNGPVQYHTAAKGFLVTPPRNLIVGQIRVFRRARARAHMPDLSCAAPAHYAHLWTLQLGLTHIESFWRDPYVVVFASRSTGRILVAVCLHR